MKKIYPIMIKFDSKEIQIGSAIVDISSREIVSRCTQENDVILEDFNIQFKKGDWITKLLSEWW